MAAEIDRKKQFKFKGEEVTGSFFSESICGEKTKEILISYSCCYTQLDNLLCCGVLLPLGKLHPLSTFGSSSPSPWTQNVDLLHYLLHLPLFKCCKSIIMQKK